MICIPVTAQSRQGALRDIEHSCLTAEAIELRMDLIAGVSLEELIGAVRRTSASVRVIVTCRKKEEASPAGFFAGRCIDAGDEPDKKMAILKEAVELGADYIDVELAEGASVITQLKAHCELRGGRTKMIVSYHNVRKTPALAVLKKIFRRCREFQPAVVKIVTFAGKTEDNLQTLSLIPYAHKYAQDIIALCMGDAGRISRAIAPQLGNFLSFATLSPGLTSAPGQLTVGEMKQIDKLLQADAPGSTLQTGEFANYVLLGNPVKQSLSPMMHNAALNDLGLAGRYTAFCVHDLAAAIQGIRGMNIRGASVTIPFKTAVMEFLDDLTDDALKIGAVNTVINDDGRLLGANTDWRGLIATLLEALPIRGSKFVIIGAGGTARAALYGIRKEGGQPIIVNRTPGKGKLLSAMFDCPVYGFGEMEKIKADCLINTTPVGMYPDVDKSPFDSTVLAGYQYVMDVIYNPLLTMMLREAAKMGCHVFSGVDMFVHQGAEQIKLWTGKEPNRLLMKKTVMERLSPVE
jgi:shikimate dehydrogenase/3-dehydroquinate dehydratase type I